MLETLNMRPKKIYKIHPAIGIARLGNADADQFFIGPETLEPGPGESPAPGDRLVLC